MSTVRVLGVLKDSLNQVAPNTNIEVYTTVGYGDTLNTAIAVHTTDDNGCYDFNVVYGTHEIRVQYLDCMACVGCSVTNCSVPDCVTISELLYYTTPIQPDIVDCIYDDIYGCIDAVEDAFDTCTTCLSCQVVQGDVGVCEAMTVYTNERLQACSAEQTTAIQAGDAQVLTQSQAYTDAAGVSISCCTTQLQTDVNTICSTMNAHCVANESAHTSICTAMVNGDACTLQQACTYTNTCTGAVEASLSAMVQACDACVYTCMCATNCQITQCIDTVCGCANVAQATADQALLDAAAAMAAADGSVTTYFQDEPPLSPPAQQGDIWIDTDDDNRNYLYTSEGWVSTESNLATELAQEALDTANQAAVDAAVAQSTADGKVNTYYLPDAPTSGMGVGDIWIDTNDGNNQYIYTASGWIDIQDQAINDAQATADAAVASSAQALLDAAAAQAAADGAIHTFYQTSTPSTGSDGDIWVDTDDGCKQYMYASGAWISIQDSAIVAAQNTANTAVDSANQAAVDAAQAQSTADGKIDTFYQNSEPTTGMGIGDIWVDTNDKNNQYMYTDSGWVDIRDQEIYCASSSAQQAAEAHADAVANAEAVCACAYADGVATCAETAAINHADAQAAAAAACACAYTDGEITSSEAAAIAYTDAQVTAAEVCMCAYADGTADAAELAAIAHADAEVALACTCSCAYADGIVTAEEQRAIADAQAKADAAEAAACAYTDTCVDCCNTAIVSCTDGLTGAIEVLECDICNVECDICLQQSGYEMVTSAGDATASISLLATDFTNTAVSCSEILMQADKIAMHNGDATDCSYPFYIEGGCVFMNSTYINYLCGLCIESPDMCAGSITATSIESSDWVPNATGLSTNGYKIFGDYTGNVQMPDGSTLINPNGLAVFNNAVIRGHLTAQSLTFVSPSDIPPEINNDNVTPVSGFNTLYNSGFKLFGSTYYYDSEETAVSIPQDWVLDDFDENMDYDFEGLSADDGVGLVYDGLTGFVTIQPSTNEEEWIDVFSTTVSVSEGQRWSASMYMGVRGQQRVIKFLIKGFDADNRTKFIDSVDFDYAESLANNQLGGTTIDRYQRMNLFKDIPAGVTRLALGFRIPVETTGVTYPDAYTDTRVYYVRPMMALVPNSQTTVPPWAPDSGASEAVERVENDLDDKLYREQSPLQISGGGYDTDPNSGWGIHENGYAVFNSGMSVNEGAIYGGTIIGVDIYGGSLLDTIDSNTNGKPDIVDSPSSALYYYENYPDIPLAAGSSSNWSKTTSIVGHLNTIYVNANLSTLSATERRGSVNSNRYRWGKVRQGDMKLYQNGEMTVNQGTRPASDQLQFTITMILYDNTGASRASYTFNCYAQDTNVTATLGGLTWRLSYDTDLFVEQDNGDKEYRIRYLKLENLTGTFGSPGSTTLNGRMRFVLSFRRPTYSNNGSIVYSQKVDNDVFPG